jgi:sugar lactone lactonase YvrE
VLGEGPCWDVDREELLWVDIAESRLHRAGLGAEGHLAATTTTQLDRPVAAVAPVAGGGHILAAGSGFVFADSSGRMRELAQPEARRAEVRMNDGACDARGRFWAGTMAYDESAGAGVLYRLDREGACVAVLDGLTISNGIGWSPDGTVMYLADSGTCRLEAFDFDVGSGEISARRTVVHITEPGIAPDGLTVDERGDIWVAMWDGGAVRRYGPEGELRSTLPLPVARPTSCAFGGPDLATLFITTARTGLGSAALARQPDAGRVFCVDGLGVRGLPSFTYQGQLSVHRG